MEFGTLLAVGTLTLLAIFWVKIPTALWNFYCRSKMVKKLPKGPQTMCGTRLTGSRVYFEWIRHIQETGHKVTGDWITPFHPGIRIHHPDPLRKVLKFSKCDSLYKFFKPWMGEAIFPVSGETCQVKRKLIAPAFHSNVLKCYIPTYNSCVDTLIKKWTPAARRNDVVMAQRDTTLLAFDTVLRCCCSYQTDCQTSENDPYVKAMHTALQEMEARAEVPHHFVTPIYFLSSAGKQHQKTLDIIYNFADRVIQERKRTLGMDREGSGHCPPEQRARKGKQMDFLDLLLSVVDKDGNRLPHVETRDLVNMFMFAATDTSGSAMPWTLYNLAKHPEHQARVREEVRNILDGRESLTYEDMKELQYTSWCIKESLRLYPSAPNFLREADEDIEIEGHMIPKGMMISVYLFTLHRHPDLWDNPNEFDPLRFHPQKAKHRDPLAYIPFSAGIRCCMGQNFAMNMMRIVIATLVNKFTFSLVDDESVEFDGAIATLHAPNDIKLRVALCED